MAKRGSSSENGKRIFLAVLGVLLVVAVIYQLYFNTPPPKSTRKPQAGGTSGTASPPGTAPAPAVPKARELGPAAQQEAMFQAMIQDLTPLNTRLISKGDGHSAAPGSRGSIFAYYVEPPRPTPPPPPPPPIQLVSLQPQTAVAGTPRPLTLVVSGNKIPSDPQILFDGAPRPTKRISETQLSTEISPGDYSLARSVNVGVKSQSKADETSNTIQFVVQPPPEPGFLYKGRLGTLNQPLYNYGLFELNSTKEIKRAKVGETINGVWRIDAISADSVDVTHTQYDIKRRLVLQDKVR